MNGERAGIGVVIEGLNDSSYFCCAYTQRFCFVSTILVVLSDCRKDWNYDGYREVAATVGQLRLLGEVDYMC